MLLVLQLLIPVSLLYWYGRSPAPSRWIWLLQILLMAGYFVGLALTGLWLGLPWWLPYGYGAITLASTVYWWLKRASIRESASASRRSLKLYAIVLTAIVVLVWTLTLQAWSGWIVPQSNSVSLSFPLKSGPYLVVSGGNHQLINSHFITLAPEKRAYFGQSYGIDLVKLNSWGTHGTGWLPQQLDQYEIYGEPVYSPCAGEVLDLADEQPDLIPPKMDLEQRKGNFVLLQCQSPEATVLLAHFQPGSVAVALGDTVQAEQPIAKVGNSGATGEPHLHIHAQRPGTTATTMDGEPLHLLFRQENQVRYPVRNQRIWGDRFRSLLD